MNPPKLRFAILLPLLDLTLWCALTLIPFGVFFVRLQTLSRGAPEVELSSGRFRMTVKREHFLSTAARLAPMRTADVENALNVPGAMIASIGRPAGFSIFSWRPLILPIGCLPFWWFAGLGIDTLKSHKRRHWSVLLLGSVLCLSFLCISLGLRFKLSPVDRIDLAWAVWGFGLWSLLLSCFPYMWATKWKHIPKHSLQTGDERG
jgi:hypothetical protein